jgi:hypothetical protein
VRKSQISKPIDTEARQLAQHRRNRTRRALEDTCLSRRVPDEATLRREIEAGVRERNAKAVPVNWRFTTQDARRRLARLDPAVSE